VFRFKEERSIAFFHFEEIFISLWITPYIIVIVDNFSVL